MDPTWQVKCGPTLQSAAAAATASTTSQQERGSQLEINAAADGPYALRPSVKLGGMPDPVSSSSLSNSGLDVSDIESSFLALLSGPPALSPYDLDSFPASKSILALNEVPLDRGCVPASAIGSQILKSFNLTSNSLPLENLARQDSVTRVPACMDGPPTANLSFQSSALAKEVVNCPLPGAEKGKHACLSNGELYSISPLNGMKHHSENVLVPPPLPLAKESSAYIQPSNFTSSCRHVFCLGASGELLVSNTGLLVIRCLCHHVDMSVSQFSKHSGLRNGNPGHVVHVDSGESIAQWRKLYFHNHGIRVPEDQSGWDWPEGLPLTAGLSRCGQSIPSNLVGTRQCSLRSVEFSEDSHLQKNPLAHDCLWMGALDGKQNRNGLVSNEFFHNGYDSKTQNHLLDCSKSKFPTMPSVKARGPENDCQFVNVRYSGSQSCAYPSLQPSSGITTSCTIGKPVGMSRGGVMDKDASSSSIELRLGQPCTRSWCSGKMGLLVTESLLSSPSPMPFPSEQKIYNACCRVVKQSKAHYPHATGLSNSSTRENDQLNHGCLPPSSFMDLDQNEEIKVNMAKASMSSTPRHLNTSFEESLCHGSTDETCHIRELKFFHTPYFHAVQNDPIREPQNVEKNDENLSHLPTFCSDRAPDDVSSIGWVSGNFSPNQDSWCRKCKPEENPNAFGGMLHGYNSSRVSEACDNNLDSPHFSPMSLHVRHARSFADQLQKVNPCKSNDQSDHVFIRSPVQFGQVLQSQEVSIDIPSYPSPSTPVLTPILHKDGGISGGLDNYLQFQTWKQNFLVLPSPLGELEQGGILSNKQDMLKIAAQPTYLGYPADLHVEKFAPIAGSESCHVFSRLKHRMPLTCKDFDMGCQVSLCNAQHCTRLSQPQSSTCQENQSENCHQSNLSWAPFKCTGAKCDARDDHSTITLGQSAIRQKTIAVSEVSGNHLVSGGATAPLKQRTELRREQSDKISWCNYQWKDAPSKATRVFERASIKQSDDALNKGQESNRPRPYTVFEVEHVEDSLKEEERSYTSSGCSYPAVTHLSVGINKMDSSTVVAGNSDYVNNLAVDEESSIDKCWSSDCTLESDRSAGFYTTAILGKEVLKVAGEQSSRSLLDEVKLMDALTRKKCSYKIERGPTFLEKSNTFQESVSNLNHGKRKGDMKLDGAKRKKSVMPLSNSLIRKRNMQSLSGGRDRNDEQHAHAGVWFKDLSRKKVRRSGSYAACTESQIEEPRPAVRGNAIRFLTSCRMGKAAFRNDRPVACGKYGVLCSGSGSKPAKIVSLDKVLKASRICPAPKKRKPGATFQCELKLKSCRLKTLPTRVCSLFKGKESGMQIACKSLVLDEEEMNNIGTGCINSENEAPAKSKPKLQEVHIRERSIYELTSIGTNSSLGKGSPKKILKQLSQIETMKIVKNSASKECCLVLSQGVGSKRCIQEQRDLFVKDADPFCSVCRSSNSDEFNYLIECGRCLIKVHQACYGISKVPKAHWYCRPCRTSARNIVCVLCGYGGGAMAEAIRSRRIVKSLLKAWEVEITCRPKNDHLSSNTSQNEMNKMNNFPERSRHYVGDLKVQNSITQGMLDSTVKQWIHMVCGLWTSDTRCPNVATMSPFDVSGVSHARTNVVCSLCQRPGGSCINCRVVDCTAQFHPWCAHQKGLLQSEAEGVRGENVGFYGRCVFHAAYQKSESAGDANSLMAHQGGEEPSCARTEGYKGRKQDGFWHNVNCQTEERMRFLVPPEQLNAWVHINGPRSSAQGSSKPALCEMEYDCRKEYARYKQVKGWKRLVVYKSGIHALGLYTSQFIRRGEMVVEYVGEIVGPRVSDKREKEYQSGRRVQYKSACYFFRIDKELVIDATRKGGIARFVNHSCLPNCMAKVISVRTEKKVVFFAVRDIYPGEEITYDYNFNSEDEGMKIPCFCNSKNCRLFLN